MNKVNRKKAKELFAGATLYNGSSFYINGYWNSCNHSCSKGNRRQHLGDQNRNSVSHLCVNAP